MKRNSAAKRPRSRPTKFENLSSNYATVLYEARDISQPSQRAANSELALAERFLATGILRSKPLTVQFAGGGGESKSYVTVKCGATCDVDVPPLHARAAANELGSGPADPEGIEPCKARPFRRSEASLHQTPDSPPGLSPHSALAAIAARSHI